METLKPNIGAPLETFFENLGCWHTDCFVYYQLGQPKTKTERKKMKTAADKKIENLQDWQEETGATRFRIEKNTPFGGVEEIGTFPDDLDPEQIEFLHDLQVVESDPEQIRLIEDFGQWHNLYSVSLV